MSSLLRELIVAEVQLLHLEIFLQRDKCAETVRSSSQLQTDATPRLIRMKQRDTRHTEIFSAWEIISMVLCPKSNLCQAYNITVILFPKQQKQWDFVLCKLSSHSSCLACNTPCNSVLPVFTCTIGSWPRVLSDGQGFASGQLMVVSNQAEAFRQDLIKHLISTGELQNEMKLCFLCFLNHFCHPSVVLFLCYRVLRVCFWAGLTQLSWENVNIVYPALCPLSFSHFWSKHEALSGIMPRNHVGTAKWNHAR